MGGLIMMYYQFVMNDITNESITINVEEIIFELFSKKLWLFKDKYPLNRQIIKLNPGDKVLLYVAGDGRKYYIAKFEIGSKVEEIELFKNQINEDIYNLFNYGIAIKNIETFDTKVPVKEILSKLLFINDEKNWGLFFRHTIKRIPEADYYKILGYSKKKIKQSNRDCL